MPVTDNSIEIRRAREDVFDYVLEMTNELAWNPDVVSMEKITPGPAGAGTKYLARWKLSGSIEVECVRAERPERVTFVNGGPIEVRLDLVLVPTGDGTRLSARFDARPHGLMRLMFPLLFRLLKRQEKQNLINLKNALENGSDGAPASG